MTLNLQIQKEVQESNGVLYLSIRQIYFSFDADTIFDTKNCFYWSLDHFSQETLFSWHLNHNTCELVPDKSRQTLSDILVNNVNRFIIQCQMMALMGKKNHPCGFILSTCTVYRAGHATFIEMISPFESNLTRLIKSQWIWTVKIKFCAKKWRIVIRKSEKVCFWRSVYYFILQFVIEC